VAAAADASTPKRIGVDSTLAHRQATSAVVTVSRMVDDPPFSVPASSWPSGRAPSTIHKYKPGRSMQAAVADIAAPKSVDEEIALARRHVTRPMAVLSARPDFAGPPTT